jgi:hypothetical protein
MLVILLSSSKPIFYMKKAFTFLLLFFSLQSLSAQTGAHRTQPLNDPGFVEFKKKHDALAGTATAPSAEKQSATIQVSEYFGYDQTLKSYFSGDVIPGETPKAISFSSKADYVKVLNNWITSNKQYLKPEHKNSLITE